MELLWSFGFIRWWRRLAQGAPVCRQALEQVRASLVVIFDRFFVEPAPVRVKTFRYSEKWER